jgi:hypothetical protein
MNDRKAALQTAINTLRAELGEIEHAESVEVVREAIGKCFKYRNCYSCPKEESDYFWLYAKVVGMRDGSAIVFEFQTDKYGHLSVKPDETYYGRAPNEDRGYQPITAAEFNAAWRAVQAKVKGWKP